MKKIETKKEEKNIDNAGSKKIDDLYGKKISARKEAAASSGITVNPLRREDVLKKTPVSAVSGKKEKEELLIEEAMEKKIKKATIAKPREKTAKNKTKSVMSDMLPNNNEAVSDKSDEEMEEMTKEELLGRKSPQEEIEGVLGEEPAYGGMTKDEILGRSPVAKEDVVATELDSDGEEKAIEAMREEIKSKLKEKNGIEQQDPFALRTALDSPDKKPFWKIFSFGKKEDSPEEVASVIVEKKENNEKVVLVGEERVAIEKKSTRDGLIVAFLVFVIMTTLGITAFYFYVKYRTPGVVPNVSLSSTEQAKKDADETKKLIGELYELPDDEEPILATVTDIEKVKSQKFFANAQNGDRLLIYTINKKAILFRPSTNKIIEISQVSGLDYNASSKQSSDPKNITSEAGKEASASGADEKKAAEATEVPTKVAIYNGSKVKGLAQEIGEMVILIPGTAVVEKTNAIGEYDKTVIIDLSGVQEDMVQRIAESLHAEILTELPAGEKKPTADILIIGGSDFKTVQ